ncbi:VOC family protein [Feifania hominis]|uniref:VOC family protein n=1 Tax=Feifania hominis TaxID=2763660 RepID=A0A926HVZ0_9FIRM|nr:VOC family protein [Feifania hominis]MBC8537141.1 VOC family protein [Feifania hominis]
MEIKTISQLAYKVTDIEKSLQFYTEILGCQHMFDFYRDDGTPWMYYLRLCPYQYIELIPTAEVEKTPKTSLHHTALIVEDIGAAAQELLEKGVPIYRGPAELGNRLYSAGEILPGGCNSPSFYIADPDGNAIEIMQFVPQSRQLTFESGVSDKQRS